MPDWKEKLGMATLGGVGYVLFWSGTGMVLTGLGIACWHGYQWLKFGFAGSYSLGEAVREAGWYPYTDWVGVNAILLSIFGWPFAAVIFVAGLVFLIFGVALCEGSGHSL